MGIDYLASEGAPSELGVAVNLVGRNRTFIPISSEFFETSDGPATGNCAELVRVAAERGRGLWGLVDLLHWEPDSSVRSTVLEKRPELVELNLQAGCGLSPSRGRYASPWRQDVRSSLVALAEAIGRHASRPLALVVRCRLSPTEMLAYNDAARAAYIRAAQLDPADLLIGTPTPSDRARTTRWLQWRLTTMTGFLGEVVHAYRKARPSGRVTAAVLANQYRRSLIERSYAAEDWLTWILDGIIDGVLLEGAWEEGSEDRDYASALGII
ncbi:MAG: hypothetical protein FJZ97_13020, partial [Chloroflexi bacterium]|nr:hypothetical protein [Chloroflexota bacterium]